jgi:hypothetical protein
MTEVSDGNWFEGVAEGPAAVDGRPCVTTLDAGRPVPSRAVERAFWRLIAASGCATLIDVIGRDPSTISRELRRDAATRAGQRVYRASVAQWKAQHAARRPKPAKIASNPRLQHYPGMRAHRSIP